ncbi:MAG: hypothetical protein AABX99_03340 [Nanoarchaeota archaeon]
MGDLKPARYFLIFAGIIVLIVAGVIVFLFTKSGSPNSVITSAPLSENNLSEGTSVVLGEKQKIDFNLNGELHQLTVNSTFESSINITIQSSIFTAIMHVGETREFDFNDNEVNDLSVTLNSISAGKADLFLKKIICFENWSCENWMGCVNRNQTRTCKDKNNCGTYVNKPLISQQCLSCSQQNGATCNSKQICNGTLINSLEGNCCLGNCTTKNIVSCNDIDCFISESKNCEISNLTYTSHENNSYYLKIRGLTDEKCVLYVELLYSAVKTEICRYQIYDLPDFLTIVKTIGIFNLSSDDLQTYQCTGDLFAV